MCQHKHGQTKWVDGNKCFNYKRWLTNARIPKKAKHRRQHLENKQDFRMKTDGLTKTSEMADTNDTRGGEGDWTEVWQMEDRKQTEGIKANVHSPSHCVISIKQSETDSKHKPFASDRVYQMRICFTAKTLWSSAVQTFCCNIPRSKKHKLHLNMHVCQRR